MATPYNIHPLADQDLPPFFTTFEFGGVTIRRENTGLWRVDGENFVISPATSSTPRWFLQSFCLEKELRDRWWKIQKGEAVLDIGAAYGSYALPALAAGAQVTAFEPSKTEFFDLCTNAWVNNFSALQPFNTLIGEGGKHFTHYYPSSHATTQEMGSSEVRIRLSIDTLVISLLHWLKIDVEGDEAKVIRGALGTIAKFRPKILVENHIASHPGVDQEIRSILVPLGYKEETLPQSDSADSWSFWT